MQYIKFTLHVLQMKISIDMVIHDLRQTNTDLALMNIITDRYSCITCRLDAKDDRAQFCIRQIQRLSFNGSLRSVVFYNLDYFHLKEFRGMGVGLPVSITLSLLCFISLDPYVVIFHVWPCQWYCRI